MTVLAASLVPDAFLKEYSETRRYMAGRPTSARVSKDGASVVFLRATPTSPSQLLYQFDVATGATTELLTPEQLLNGAAETMNAAEKARLERMRVTARGFTSFSLSSDGAKVLVTLSGKPYVFDRKTKKTTALKVGDGVAIDAKFSPDGTLVGYVRNNDVYVVDLKTNTEHAVTTGGTDVKPQGLAEFVAQEEMSRFAGFWFSPDSTQVVFQQTDHAGLEQFAVADPMHPEAMVDRFYYPRPGRKNAAVRLGLVSSKGGAVTWVAWDEAKFPYVSIVRWSKKAPLAVAVQNREQTDQQLLFVDAATGKTTVVLSEHDDAWHNINQEFPRFLPDGKSFLWADEKDGAPRVVEFGLDGKALRTWVPKEAGYLDLVGYHEKTESLYFTGGADPTATLLYRVKKGGAVERVATGNPDTVTEAAVMGEDAGLLSVTTTSASAMPQTIIAKLDGTKVGVLPSVAKEPALTPQIDYRTVGKERQFRAAIIKPRAFKAGKKYPVILQVYGGPGHLEVVRAMQPNLLLQWLADKGFIVVKFDGRGTPRRGREWERAIKFDFATNPAADQVAALKALGAEVPEMDMARVGVYGWSFGGYMASLLTLSQPGVFKSGVAGAPVVDWKDYDTHYTERFLGLPDAHPEAYEKSSLLSFVAGAERPLLLIHGTADDNVYFLHSLKLSDAMFKAGKAHELLPLTNFTHMVPEPVVLQRLWERIARQFQETL